MGEKYYMNGCGNTCANEYQLMKKVYETSFALDDLGLYINTHPCDKEAKSAYASMKLAEEKAEEAYIMGTGRPIRQVHAAKENVNDWAAKPWPWEGVY